MEEREKKREKFFFLSRKRSKDPSCVTRFFGVFKKDRQGKLYNKNTRVYINPGPAVNQRQARAKGGLELPPAHRLAPRHRGRAKLGSERRENGGRGEKGKRREGGATEGGSENVQLHPQNYPARVKRTRSSAYR